jgi:hypothetical protein
MLKETNSLSKYYITIAKHHKKIISIIGVLIFIPVLIKFLIKGVNNIDKIDLFVDLLVDIAIYSIFLVIVITMRKKYKDQI